MAIYERIHLGRQQEGIDESGVQVRPDDPATPVENQVWINSTQNFLKLRKDGETIILAQGSIGAALEIPPSGILDIKTARSWYKTVTGNVDINSFENFREGLSVYISVKNTNPEVTQISKITATSPTNIPLGSYLFINSASNEEEYVLWIDYDGAGSAPSIGGKIPLKINSSIGLKQVTKITCSSSSGIISGQYFLIKSANDTASFYVWFNVDGAGNDPLLSGVGIMVNVNASDSAEITASKLSTTLNLNAAFDATVSGTEVTVENASIGTTTPAENGNLAAFTFNTTRLGKNIQPSATLAMEISNVLLSTGKFNTTVLGTEITVETLTGGFTDATQNVNMGAQLLVSTLQTGSGKIRVNFPANVSPTLTDSDFDFVSSESTKVFSCFRVGSSILVGTNQYT